MKYALLFLVCGWLGGCHTTPNATARVVLRNADLVLGREHRAREFERRLDELGAQIAKGSLPEERVATIALPGRPGYFPPRTVQVVYVITGDGLVVVRRANVTSLGSPFARSRPPEESTRAG